MQRAVAHFYIFRALVRKEMRVLFAKISTLLLDSLFPVIAQVITFGYLFPLMGMSSTLVAPIYIGSILTLLLHMGYSVGLRTLFDLEQNRFIDYQVTLPIPIRWLCASFVISTALEFAVLFIPLMIGSFLLLPSVLNAAHVDFLGFALISLLSFLFFATFFWATSFTYTLSWVMANLWPRRLVPLWWFSCSLFTWKQVYTFWPLLAKLFLLNPITYVAEGFRAALLGGSDYIPLSYCCWALLFFICCNCIQLRRGISKKLDPV